ncbi:MAG: hypothetical protein JW800_02710 [Candidatus Omnitrophica bacterium]|nr:hypothetical protein [Candidatus Omnitrophota bacterium]
MDTIVTVIDDKFFKYIIPWLNSIIKNYPTYPHILVYHHNLNKEQIQYLSGFERLSLIEIDLQKDKIGPTTFRMSKQTYAKYLYFLDTEYDKILHIDPDALILKPLDGLFGQNNFFSVNCINTNTFRIPRSIYRRIRLKTMLFRDGLKQNSKFIMNAGVLMIPRRYRTKDNYDYLAYLTRRYFRYLKHRDQSAINMWMWKNHIKPSDKIEFNYQSRFFHLPERNKPPSDIYILHFVGQHKPDSEWFRNRYDKEIIDLYDYYASMRAR